MAGQAERKESQAPEAVIVYYAESAILSEISSEWTLLFGL
jgi:hypothetical protein